MMAVGVRSVGAARSRLEKAIARVRSESTGSEPLPQGPVALYGAGRMGTRVEQMLAEKGVPIRCFLDRGKQQVDGGNGVPVYHPERNSLERYERAGLHVIVTVFNPDADPAGIKEALLRAGYGRVTDFLEFYHRYGRTLGDHYWLTALEFYQPHTDQILQSLDLWADETSRELFASVLEYRLGSGKERLPSPSLNDQYFPSDLSVDPRPLHLVDCGAFTGDTIAEAMGRGTRFESVCAFEPDPDNFRALVARAKARTEDQRFPLYLWPCAVGRESGLAQFEGKAGGASRLVPTGAQLVPCVALDDVIPDFPVSLLKLDIEGGEPDALAGATQAISRWRPRLAICVYHRPEHLWTIPTLVQRLHPAYDLLLRLHRFNGFDLVLYALPRA